MLSCPVLPLAQATMGHDEDMYRFAEEFIASVNRVNYNQDNGINALAGELPEHFASPCPNASS